MTGRQAGFGFTAETKRKVRILVFHRRCLVVNKDIEI